MFDNIWKQLFLTLINKQKYQRKFEAVHENCSSSFYPKNVTYGINMLLIMHQNYDGHRQLHQRTTYNKEMLFYEKYFAFACFPWFPICFQRFFQTLTDVIYQQALEVSSQNDKIKSFCENKLNT